MPFDLRCPSCQAKLRLDEAPKPRSAVECPKCGESFAAPARAVAPKEAPKSEEAKKPKAGAEDTKPATGTKVVGKDRVHMNEFALLGMVGVCVLVFGLLLATVMWYLNKAAKVADLLAMMPKTAEAVRGVSYGQLKKYPGYKSILEKHYTGNVKAAFEEIDKAAAGGGADEWLNFFLLGRGPDGLSVLFNVKKKFDPATLGAALKGTAGTQGGATYYRLPAGGNPLLSRALLYCPTDMNILLLPEVPGAPAGQPSRAVLTRLDQASSYKTEKAENRLPGDLGSAGNLAIRGHSWEVIRPTGEMKADAQQVGRFAKKGLPGNNDAKEEATDKNAPAGLIGWWVTVGGRGVRLGFATEMASSEEASAAAKLYQNGPLGKGDESEVPNGTKRMISESGQKEFLEFLQNLSFKSKGTAAYLVSKMETGPEKSRSVVALFLKTWGGDPFTGASGGGGMPGGMPGVPGGR